MEGVQDGGPQNMKSDHDYPPQIEGSRINSEMNNFPHSSGEGPESFTKMSEGMHTNQMQNYPGYSRGTFGISEQHGGMTTSSGDYNNQSAQFSGHFPHNPVRPSYPVMSRSSMSPVRAGQMPPGLAMPGSYSSSQRMMPSQSQNGPTPTLNQLLQTSSGQRFPGNYSDFTSQGKGGEMSGAASYPLGQQGWNGNPRTMSYPQGPGIGGTPYRSQGNSMPENRLPSGMSSGQGPGGGYPYQGQYMNPAMAASAQRYMTGQVRPSHMTPMSSHGYNQMPPHSLSYSPSMSHQPSQLASREQQQQQQHMYHVQQQQPQPPGPPSSTQPSPSLTQQQVAASSSSSLRPPACHSQGLSPTQASSASQGMMGEQASNQTSVNMKKSEEISEPSGENCLGEEHRREQGGHERCSSTGSQSQLGVSGGRAAPSPAGSTGSRSDTPASNSGAQVNSPMPPRPPSSQGESQNHTSHSPMATQAGYSQPMMPPPVPGHMGYPGSAGGKMGGSTAMGGTPVPPHFPQYASQYAQGGYRGQPGMGGMQGAGGSYPQAMYNGPNSQMGPGGPSMYNSMMSRNMQNYNTLYGPSSSLTMNSHYGSFNSHIGPGHAPGPGPGPASGSSQGQSSAGPMPMGSGQVMGGQAGMTSSGPPGLSMLPGGKGAQAAAQAAVLAAASSTGARMSGRGMPLSPRMMGPQGNGPSSPGMMNHMGNLGNPSLASMSNQIQQITSSSVTGLGKPSSPAGSCPIPPGSTNSTSTLVDNAGPAMGSAGQSSMGGGSAGESTNLMSPLSGSDTQESSRPSSTATPGQPVDAGNSVTDLVGSEGSGSVPGSDSTSVDSGFHSAADHSEKPPSESVSTQSSSPSNPIPPPSASGQIEEEASQDGLCKVMNSTSTSIPTSLHLSTTTITVTNASVDMVTTQSVSSVSGSQQSAGSQTSTSMPVTKAGTHSSQASSTTVPNGPHYPHHPHPHMGYQMGPRGSGPMGSYHHMMGGYGAHPPHHHHHHHPGMHPMGNMTPYSMPPGSMGPGTVSGAAGMHASGMPANMSSGNMPSSMPPGSMPSSTLSGNMLSSVPPGNMPGNMASGNMPSNMDPGNMPNSMSQRSMHSNLTPGNMPGNMPPGSMPSSMSPGNMPSNIPSGSMPSNMPPGSMPSNMPQGNMPPGNMPSNIPSGNMPSSLVPRNMPSNMAQGNMSDSMHSGNMSSSMPNHMPASSMSGSMPSNMPGGNIPHGSMPPNSMPSAMPPGNSSMPSSSMASSSMPQGNMPSSMAQGNMPNSIPPQGNMHGNMAPENVSPGTMPNSMPQGNMPNNLPPGSGVPGVYQGTTMAAGGGLKSGLNRGGMPNHMQSGAMPNSLPPGVALNHAAHGVMSGAGPQPRTGMGDANNHALGPGGTMPQKNFGPPALAVSEDLPAVPEKKKKDEGVMVGAGPLYCEDYENSSSPGWPGMPKASDVTRLYDMGNERDRRPFLDQLFAFLEEKGTPLTTMPNISKQPLDLFALYHCVREKGGMVEVNKGKRWKEICSVVNIGTSASAAFTLKKNYIRYLFAFECKYDLGGLDPAPILQEMESHTERKRDRKRVPSPGSQSSQDGFQQAPPVNSHMMDGYPGGMPPPYMQGLDGQMMPAGMGSHGPGMLMPNNMMGHPGMMPPHPGSGNAMMGHSSSGMMNSGMPPNMGPGQNMMSGNMGPQGGMMNSGSSMMGSGGMMGPGMPMGPGGYSGGPPNSMMGPGSSGSSSMGPSPGPPMMAGSSSSGTNTAPSPVPGSVSSGGMAPPTSNGPSLPPSSTPSSRPATADSVSVQDPFADEPSKVTSPAAFQHRAGGPTPSPTPGGFPSPGPPTTSGPSGFGSRPSSASNSSSAAFPSSPASEQPSSSFRRSSENFQTNSVGMFPGRSESSRFAFGPESSSHPGQPYRSSSDSSEPSFTPRFPGPQPPFSPGGPGEAYSGAHPFPGPGYGPRMPGQEHFSSFSGVRPPMSHEGSFSSPGGWMSHYSDWNGAGGMGQAPCSSHPESYSDYNMSGREGVAWSPMHAQRAFPPSSGAPDTALGRAFGRSHRGSPHARDKVLNRLQKGVAMQSSSPFSPKKEIHFPEHSVEAVQPSLNKRRRLTHKDLAPVEAWRLMMALKSGLLAESTWAIDTLNILLFDDATVTYFNLTRMPGLLEVLTEHLRAALIHAFHILQDRELYGFRSSDSCCCEGSGHDSEEDSDDKMGDELAKLLEEGSEAHIDAGQCCSNYTWISRQGKAVVKEDKTSDCAVLDAKHWDVFSGFSSGKRHWQKGSGDITQHVVPCFESDATQRLLTDLFYAQRTSKDKERKEARKRKAASEEDLNVDEERRSSCRGGSERQCRRNCQHAKCPKDCVKSECVGDSGNVVDKHSNVGSLTDLKNHVISKVEIKEEVQETEFSRCESDDSLPPPVLPAATQDDPASCEEGCGQENNTGNSSQTNDVEEKTMPPDLTCEKVDEERKTKNEADEEKMSKDEEVDEEKEARNEQSDQDQQENKIENEMPLEASETKTSIEEKTTVEIQATMEKSEDEMTSEIVAMMTKEQDQEMEEEAYRHDDAPLTMVQADQEEMGRRCVAISNIFRNLSCIPGNEALLSRHQGFMMVVGQLLMLHHWHPPRSKAKPAPPLPSEHDDVPVEENKEEVSMDESEAANEDKEEKDWATSPEWWWDMLETLRENVLVVLANISSHMHMRDMDSDVCLPILDGLLHWMVCPSSVACDPFPLAPSASQLSPQRLAMEALCKLCIHSDNVDLLLATPPFSRILLLLGRLMNFLSDRSQQVPREFSIVLLSRLVQADTVAARAIALQHPSISLLLEFLESAEQSAMAAASQQRGHLSSNNPEVLGTSLDMLCRAASTLLHIARVPANRKLFLHHQSRLLALVMSQILDTGVTRIISDVLFECSQSDLSPT